MCDALCFCFRHLYYLQNYELKLEKIAAKKISMSSDCYEVSEMDYPAPCYAFQIRVRCTFSHLTLKMEQYFSSIYLMYEYLPPIYISVSR